MNIKSIHKKIYIMVGLCLAIVFATGVTYALLSTKSEPNVNDFTGGQTKINISVVEDIDQGKNHEDISNGYVEYTSIKKGESADKVVRIKNLNSADYVTTDTYVRVKLIPMIVKDGSVESSRQVLGDAVEVSYTFADNTKWVKDGDTYYFTEAIRPDATSDVLINKVTLQSDIPDGYHLEIQVLSDAIGANPKSNLHAAWGLQETNGSYFSTMSAVK